jgi:predicted nucleotidyltransferase
MRSDAETKGPDQGGIDEIVRRIVEAASPEQVLLFGSAARGMTGPHSDLDFLIVKAGRYNPRTVARDIYIRLRGIRQPVDLVVVTPTQVRKYRESPFSIVYPAFREGTVVYERKKEIAG